MVISRGRMFHIILGGVYSVFDQDEGSISCKLCFLGRLLGRVLCSVVVMDWVADSE